MTEEKYVTYKQLKEGQKIYGVKQDCLIGRFSGYIKEVNVAYVIVELWERGGVEDKYFSQGTLFVVKMTEEEIIAKYNQKAGEFVKAIQNRLESYEIGPHEMWNSWLSSDPWELAQACVKEKLTIIGSCYDIIPKRPMFSDELLDVGVCVEDEDGDRFWCHFGSSDIEIMKRRYERYQEYMKEKGER